MKTRASQRSLAAVLVALSLTAWSPSLHAAVTVHVNGPGGGLTQTLPDNGGAFDLTLPLNANAVNTLTVSATDVFSNRVAKVINVTQLSLQSLVVAEVRVDPLPPERIVELVNEGVIQLDDPENFNVSVFDIVLTIGGQRVPISVPIVTPIAQMETGFETIPMPNDPGSGGNPNPRPNVEVIVFETVPVVGTPGIPPPRIYGVMVIEGRIKTLKEFFSTRLLLMNTSGIFTLKDVMAKLTFPDGGLSHTLPSDGVVSFGDILPGDGSTPGQKEREFIMRGDEIGVRRVQIEFGGTLAGPGLPEDPPIPFSGSAGSTVEVKGPPQFLVQVFHPPVVVSTNDPYELIVEIQNTGELPALYASLDLEVGADGLLERCGVETNSGSPEVVCTYSHDPVTRAFGHIYPGERVRETFRVKALVDGPITSCLGISDQNIQLQVTVGNIGCLTGHYPPTTGVPDGLPTVAVVPLPNQLGVSPTVAVTAFFSEPMNAGSITTGSNGTFNVFHADGSLVNGGLRLIEIGGRTAAIWQRDAGMNILDENTEYDVVLTEGILDLDGNALFNPWNSSFRTTGLYNDQDPPELSLTILPPVDANAVLPGQTVVVNAYPADQGSGIQRVELRLKDMDGTNALHTFIDQKTVFDPLLIVTEPMLFTLDTSALIPGHTHQLLGTAYDVAGNVRDATIAMIMANSSAPPAIVLPPDPTNVVLQGISISISPLSVSGGVTRVEWFLNEATNAFSTAFLPPWSAFLRTHDLPFGVHTVRVEAVDGLLQTGSDDWVFGLAFNPNGPQVDFGSEADGKVYPTGSVINVRASITDPVGVAGVRFHLDSTANPPLATGSAPFAFATTGMATGLHQVIVVASNTLNQANDPGHPDSVLDFVLVAPPPGLPPPAPVVTSVSPPQAGQTQVAGASVAGARIDIRNTTLGLTLTLTTDGGGAFAGQLDANGGDRLEVTATMPDTSPLPSAITAVVVPALPVFTALAVSPTSLTFTAAGQFQDLAVQATVQGVGLSNVTAQSTFSSSASSVASVNAAGRVVAHTPGATLITATFGALSAPCPVAANIRVLTGLVVNPPSVLLVFTDQTAQITVTGQFNDGSSEALSSGVTYGNSDPVVITVSPVGLLTAKADGAAQVYVSAGALPPVNVPVSVISGLNPPPVTQILSPAPGTGVEAGGQIDVVVRGDDPTGGVTRLNFTASGAVTASDTRQVSPPAASVTRTFTLAVPASAPVGSTVTLRAKATDVAGLESPDALVDVIVADTMLPTVTLLAPTNGAAYNTGSTVTVAVAASDTAGLAQIGYRTSGALALDDVQTFPTGVTSSNAIFTFVIPGGVPEPEFLLSAFARDHAGNEQVTSLITLMLTDVDLSPPETVVTAVTAPGVGVTTLASIDVLAGADDLAHVELYFRRNGIGTFNRYTEATGTNVLGQFAVTGTNAVVLFDSTAMGGDGLYEFYSVGVDAQGNREAAPTNGADQVTTFAAGTVWVTIGSNTVIGAGDTTFDNQNLRVSDAVVTLEGSHHFHNMELLGTSVLTHATATLVAEPAFALNVWTLSVASNSTIVVDGRGYLGGLRGGNGHSGLTTNQSAGAVPRSAGSHGGAGGVWDGAGSNPLYGNLTTPTELGAGGSSDSGGQPGGSGGGRIRIAAINIAADGVLSANGENALGFNRAGCGAGGSIYLTVRTLSGRGAIRANGGGRELGGGGGRVAVHYLDLSTKDTALIQALGGVGAFMTGGNGTVFLLDPSGGDGTLVIDGQGVGSPFSGLPIPPGLVFDNLVLRNGARVIADDPIEVHDRLEVLSGSVLTHSQGNTSGLVVRASHVLVDETSAMDVTGKGYAGGLRPGNLSGHGGLTLGGVTGALTRSAGSYGGLGGIFDAPRHMPVYGMPEAPVYLGSGGSSDTGGQPGGSGGGRITLQASGSVTVHGALRADGEAAVGFNRAGCGSGGSIWIDTGFFQGRGVVRAHGGAREVGGGGGRIAVFYEFLGSGTNRFGNLRQVSAAGGKAAFVVGSAGTVYWRQRSQVNGELVVDAQESTNTAALWTPLPRLGRGVITGLTANTLWVDGAVVLPRDGLVGLRVRPNRQASALFTVIANSTNSVTVDVSGGTNLTDVAVVGDVYVARHRYDNVTLRGGGFLVTSDDLVVDGTLRLAEQASLTHFNATLAYEPGLDVTAGTLVVESNATINVNGRGYLGGLIGGNGHVGRTVGNAAGAQPRSAGSFGGSGAFFEGPGSNPAYGDPTEPLELGAGGSSDGGGQPGGSGGGRVRITAGALQLDGLLLANGQNALGFNAPGSGSGGAVLIDVGVLSGVGRVRANGGASDLGGGGGRVAVRYATLSMADTQFEARGGQAVFVDGGNGTIFLKRATQSGGHLIIDGGGLVTPMDSTPWPAGYVFDMITVRNQARVVASSPLRATEQLQIREQSRLSHPIGLEAGVVLEAALMEIDASSTVDVTAKGYRGALRPGNSTNHFGVTVGGAAGAVPRAAGSHGGSGASWDGAGNNAIYGSATAPGALGAGGSSDGGGQPGGHGGGRITLMATNLVVDGGIVADGEDAPGFNLPGSGSGGSIQILVGGITGVGVVRANGGAKDLGGGGGRIAVQYDTLGIQPHQLQARGGQGAFRAGGNGTVVLRDNAAVQADLVIDGFNFTTPPSSTPYPTGSVFRAVTLRNRAQVVAQEPIHVGGTLSLLGASTLTHPPGYEAGLHVEAGTVLIEAGSTINLNAKGYPGGLLPGNVGNAYGITLGGTTGALARSGGSYGGAGAVWDGPGSNPLYGSAANPAELGSGGSSDGGGQPGGYGGGRLTLIASNVVVNGTIQAIGQDAAGFNLAGSGSGGAVLMMVKSLSGTGTVSVVGGAREVGGGGGRVAIYYEVLALPTNNVRTAGGSGTFASGAAGSIHWELQPFAFGSEPPETPSGFARIVSFAARPDGEFDIRWTGAKSTWILEGCTSLTAGDWRPLSSPTTATQWTAPRATVDDIRFLRVRAP